MITGRITRYKKIPDGSPKPIVISSYLFGTYIKRDTIASQQNHLLSRPLSTDRVQSIESNNDSEMPISSDPDCDLTGKL